MMSDSNVVTCSDRSAKWLEEIHEVLIKETGLPRQKMNPIKIDGKHAVMMSPCSRCYEKAHLERMVCEFNEQLKKRDIIGELTHKTRE